VLQREIELERGESNAVPFLIITVVVFAVAAAVLHFVLESQKLLSVEQATQLVTSALNAQEPSTVRFHTGLVKDRPGESPRDARYRLLEHAGVLNIGPSTGSRTPVALTERGSEILSEIRGVKRSKEPDGSEAYVAPLAVRRLVNIANIQMEGADRATVEYTWQWQPNTLGESFDRLGPAMMFMSAQDRLDLANRFDARYYHAVPKSEVIRVTKSAHGWQVAPE
jgi:hypothetical protein